MSERDTWNSDCNSDSYCDSSAIGDPNRDSDRHRHDWHANTDADSVLTRDYALDEPGDHTC